MLRRIRLFIVLLGTLAPSAFAAAPPTLEIVAMRLIAALVP